MPNGEQPVEPTQPVTARPASATVLIRDGEGGSDGNAGGVEVFMVRRHVQSEFVPDVFVFPGGSVNAADRAVERAPHLCAPVGEGATTLGSGFRAAALREMFEEAGVLLARTGATPLTFDAATVARYGAYRDQLNARQSTLAQIAEREGLTLATDALLHWAHWITPEAWPKRFDTHFFLAAAPAGQQAAHDALETTDSVWITPEDALASFERGDFPLVFATIHQLRDLTDLPDVATAFARFTNTTPRTIMPRVVQRDGADVILLPDEE
ncbi:MAG: NUDIX hydrolase [Ktedonobacterales bacterium]